MTHLGCRSWTRIGREQLHLMDCQNQTFMASGRRSEMKLDVVSCGGHLRSTGCQGKDRGSSRYDNTRLNDTVLV
jgi:hypothetical protein